MEVVAGAASVAGLVSLGIQLGESAMKLKRIYNSMRDAPANIENLALELTTMELHFRQLARHRNLSYGDDDFLIDMLVETCKAKVLKIAALSERIEGRMEKSRLLGRMYMSFMERDIAQLWQEVEREKSSLFFAWQATSSMRMQAKQDQLIEMTQNALGLLNVKQQKLSVTDAPIEDAGPALWYTKGPHHKRLPETKLQKKKRKRPYSVHIRPWFSQQVWQLTFAQAEAGWDVALRTWNVVSSTSEVFELSRRGDIAGIRDLVIAGKASFLDRDEVGYTLLQGVQDMAIGCVNPCDMAVFLVTAARELQEEALMAEVLDSVRINSHHHDRGKTNVRRLYTIFFRDLGLDMERIMELYSGKPYWPDLIEPSCLKIILSSDPSFASWSLKKRLEVAVLLNLDCSPSEFLEACGADNVSWSLATASLTNGSTALHFACEALRSALRPEDPKTAYRAGLWKDFVVELMRNGANVHKTRHITLERKLTLTTPLLTLVGSYTYSSYEDPAKIWASLLADAGLDLTWCGEREVLAWAQKQGSYKADLQIHDGYNAPATISLNYGARASQWNLVAHRKAVVPEYVLERVPGAWCFALEIPRTICWVPSSAERLEGSWRLLDRHELLSGPLSWIDLVSEHHYEMDPDFGSWTTHQDDLKAPLFMDQQRPQRKFGQRERSLSMPRPVGRTPDYGVNPMQLGHRSSRLSRFWYHCCLGSGKQSIGLVERAYDWDVPECGYSDVRDCLKGHDGIPSDFYDDLARGLRMDRLAGLI